MHIILEKILAPFSNQHRLLDVAQTWEVRWTSRHGQYSSDTRPEAEIFVTEAEARHFATALENAFKLLRHRSDTTVTVTKKGPR